MLSVGKLMSTTITRQEKFFRFFPFIFVFYEITHYLANDMYLPSLPHLVADLHTTTYLGQQTITVWFIGSVTLQLILGPLSDRFGRRPILFMGGCLFILSSLACALTMNIHVLLVSRFFQGTAICAVITAGYSSIHELYERIRAIQILAIMGSIVVLAPAFGPLVGGVLLQWLSWRWIFGLLAIWGFIGLSALWFLMPESNLPEKRQIHHWKLLAKNYLSIFSNPTFLSNTLIFCVTFLGMIAWITAGPFIVITKFKLNTLIFGLLQALVFGGLIVGAQAVKYLVDKIGTGRLITLGLAINLLGSLSAFILTLLFPHFLMGLVIGLVFFSFGSSLAFSSLQRNAIEACTEPMGARIAVLSTLMSLFGAIGSLLVSLIYTGTLLWFGILLLIVSGIACLIKFLGKS